MKHIVNYFLLVTVELWKKLDVGIKSELDAGVLAMEKTGTLMSDRTLMNAPVKRLNGPDGDASSMLETIIGKISQTSNF